MARFFTADLHLGHCNIARYHPGRALAAGVAPLRASAGDETQSHLDSFLINQSNEVVGPDDEVWLLGDACMGRLDRTIDRLSRLLGRSPEDHGRVLLHGRVHSAWRTDGCMVNVGVDVWDYAPIPGRQVVEVVRIAAG